MFNSSGSEQDEMIKPRHVSGSSTEAIRVDCVGMSRKGITTIEVLGIQAKILADLIKCGCDCFDNPLSFFNRSWVCGIMPKHIDISRSQDKHFYHDALLSIALEYDVMTFIRQCIDTWETSAMSNARGSLKLVLKWVWERVKQIKNQLDELHVPLFVDPSASIAIDASETFETASWQLNRLSSLLIRLTSTGVTLSETGKNELDIKVLVTQCIWKYSTVVSSLLKCKILPICQGSQWSSPTRIQYNPERLLQEMIDERSCLEELNKGSRWPADKLFIDHICEDIEICIEDSLFEEETEWDGTYPPSSVNAICKSFLIPIADFSTRERILCYWLHDLMETSTGQPLPSEDFQQAIASLDLGDVDIQSIEAMRLLDRGFCEEAIEVLSKINTTIAPSDCSKLARHLHLRGYSEQALQLLALGASSSTDSHLDAEFHINMLVKHGRVMDAYNMQKSLDPNQKVGLLVSFFNACLTNNSADSLLDFPLTEHELELLFSLLSEDLNSSCKDLIVALAAYRRCHVRIGGLNSRVKERKSNISPENKYTQSIILKTYLKLLPRTQFDVATLEMRDFIKQRKSRKELARPNILSTLLKPFNHQPPSSRACLLFNAIQTVDEVNRVEVDGKNRSQTLPFVSAAVPMYNRSEISPMLSSLDAVTRQSVTDLDSLQLQQQRSVIAEKSIRSFDRVRRDLLDSSSAAIRTLRTPASKKFLSQRFSLKNDRESQSSLKTPASILKSTKKAVFIEPKKRVEEQRKIRFDMSDSDEDEIFTADQNLTVIPSVRRGITIKEEPTVETHIKKEDRDTTDGDSSMVAVDETLVQADLTENQPTPDQSLSDASFVSAHDDSSNLIESPDAPLANSSTLESQNNGEQLGNYSDISLTSHSHSGSFTAINSFSESLPLCACSDHLLEDTVDQSTIESTLHNRSTKTSFFEETMNYVDGSQHEETLEEPSAINSTCSSRLDETLQNSTAAMFTESETSKIDIETSKLDNDSEILLSPKKKPRRQSRSKKTDAIQNPRVLRSTEKKRRESGISIASSSPLSFAGDSNPDTQDPTTSKSARTTRRKSKLSESGNLSIKTEKTVSHRMTLRTRTPKK